MDEGLDTGNIVYQRTFDKPNYSYIDEVFDAHIRSETMIDMLKKELLLKDIVKPQNVNHGNTYYIIHPVLKHIAILDCIKN
jgi:methionyl-tRNA formyltransferase